MKITEIIDCQILQASWHNWLNEKRQIFGGGIAEEANGDASTGYFGRCFLKTE